MHLYLENTNLSFSGDQNVQTKPCSRLVKEILKFTKSTKYKIIGKYKSICQYT